MDNDYVRLLEKKVDDLTDQVSALQKKVEVLADSNLNVSNKFDNIKSELKQLDNSHSWFVLFVIVVFIILGFLTVNYGLPMYDDWKKIHGLVDSLEGVLSSYSNYF
jgi:hypothetical protein